MVTARQYFGDPIDCITRDDIPRSLLDTYCWIHTTFSVESAWTKEVGEEVPYPGVDKYSKKDGGGRKIYHAYYQWVCFVLFFQSVLFYIPHYLWKAIEGGRTRILMLGLNNPIMHKTDKDKNIEILTQYLMKNMGHHNKSFAFYSFTEVLNFLNVLLQMHMIDRFLGGEFSRYGWEVLQFTEWDWSVRYDPMIRVFPRLTKCTFHLYGPSGDIQRHDAMCILPINIVNEKIYVFLWFWFYFLAFSSFIAVIYRFIIILSPKIRAIATQSRCRYVDRQALSGIVEKLHIGDWFILDLLSKNLEPVNFNQLVDEYFKEVAGAKNTFNI
ncbi:Innexin inx2 [Halotydeus destructor]|nr:Innexin inx2 [Halotydeus destructor]